MKYRTRIYYSEEQKSLMWDRWQKVSLYIRLLDFLIGITQAFLGFCQEQVAFVHEEENAQP